VSSILLKNKHENVNALAYWGRNEIEKNQKVLLKLTDL
jgi:hypothetical protein